VDCAYLRRFANNSGCERSGASKGHAWPVRRQVTRKKGRRVSRPSGTKLRVMGSIDD
jgi:hypothetical protein